MNELTRRAGVAGVAQVLLAFAVCGLPSASAAEPGGMTAVDMVELSRLSDPVLAPDGNHVLFLRTEVDWIENKVVNRIQSLAPGSDVSVSVLEPEEASESFNEAIWLRSHDKILTTLERDDDEHEQAYVFDVSTKTLTRQTRHPTKVDDIVLSPDAKGFYFRAAASKPEPKIGDSAGRWSIEEYETEPANEVWYVDLATLEANQLVAGDFDVRTYEISRDGSYILYVKGASALRDEQDRNLWVYDIASDKSLQVTDNNFVETNATISPDNRHVAFIATVNSRGDPYYEDNVFVQAIGSDSAVLLLPEMAMEMNGVAWDRSGSGLYLLGNTGLRTHLYHYDLETAELVNLTPGDHVIDDWSYDAAVGAHVFRIVSASNPGEIWVLEEGAEAPRQVSYEYAGFEQRFRLPRQTAFRWRGRGSVDLEGLLVYPLDHEPGERAPLVTITHGGPRSSSQFGSWNMSRYVPVLAAQGYAVFLPNHRGGTGYGDDFMRDMVGNYFRNSHRDVLAGIDALVDAGIADPDQLIKMGWSAGGHMTNKLVTITDRFRAASSGAGAADWVSMFGESDLRYNREPWFGGAPWTRRAPLRSYARQSPLKDAWRITTPTLFHVGAKDERVPPTQSILMYRATKAAGAETELYVAPDEEHQFKMPSHRLFKINKDLEWFSRHLERPPYEPVYPRARYEQTQ